MFGSLDCMHTYWKNCPVAWQGSYKGTERKPSIVLEAIADYHLWFWHGAYGYAGAMNNKSIWSMLPFLSKLIDGTFAKEEKGVVPFKIGEEVFDYMNILVDGIYPHLSRFVHCMKVAIREKDKKYTARQEGARKDIKRAFGVLKAKWQCLARPMHQLSLKQIGARMQCCMILHNMCVSDRVMNGNVRARYIPSYTVNNKENVERINYPKDLLEKQGRTNKKDRAVIGASTLDRATANELARVDRWRALHKEFDFIRLHCALSKEINGNRLKQKRNNI